ncbi:MAG TPA: carboxypeptidase regulatory-like domain-containing protein, partial [Solibacterales bacterium]|nr:carboxypeptidase regulatory-like domain-containing protein [Bryobacterales bacterium]
SIGYQVEGAANTYPNGIIPASAIDRNGQQLINLYPGSNASVQSTGGFNFVNVSTKPQNAYQLRPRVDWSISDNTKVFFSYNRQRDTAYYLDTLWWRPDPTVPYPTRIIAANESDSISANLTHVFSPTLTNELVVTYTYLNLPNSFEDPSKVDRAALGIQFPTLFKNSVPQIPTLTGWGGGFANLIQPSGYQLTGSLYAKKTLPNIANNLSKVWGTHTAKFGFYWQSTTNDQPSSENANGQLIFANWGGNTSGNAYADLLTGRMAQYAERNKDVLFVMNYRQMDFYGQDSWKVTRRLTLDFGLRLSHLGPWRDTRGSGFAVFDRARYSNNPADVNKLTGIVWNQLDTSIPLSGAPSRALFYNPRFGMAWDIFGNGQTVMRGGWGVYRFHDEQNVVAGALGITQGSFGYTTPTAVTFQEIGAIQASFVAPGGVTVLDKNDNRQPTTRSYSFTISQKMPFKSLLEVAYVGNESYHLSNWNNGFGGLNLLPAGTLFRTPGQFTSDNNYAPNADPLRPFRNYQSIKVINHEMFSNYNSLQVSWNKQTGKVNYMVNYTFGKSLGIRGEGGAPTGDPTNLANNYGVLNNDRTHIFNIAYVIELPNAPTSNRLLRGVSHGWQISGISQFQSGANLQGVVSSNFGMSGTIPAGTRLPDGTIIDRNIGLGAVQITGSPDVQAQPRLTCDPRQGRKEGQFINGACFAVPTPGNNGPFVMPYVKGPAFYNNDVSLFKNFNLSESRKLQFRVSAFNVLNHPLRSFQNGDQNLLLAFNERGQLNNNRFGYADWTIGKRIFMLAAKFYF